ncbi:MAG TPA: YceI family protein [Gemmatimonadales bacterium]|nr:YceI family protein [Gemmatimonadales bacterium]
MIKLRSIVLGILVLPFLACGGSDAGETTLVADSLAAAALGNGSGVVALRLAVAPEGNSARYRVREQLLGRDFPNDAVGETTDIAGAIAVDSSGALVAGESRIVVGVSAITSDSDRRDGYVRRRLLVTDTFPSVEFVPTELRGLPTLSESVARSGSHTFEMIGDLTVRGVTRPTTWQVTAEYTDGQVKGSAATAFTFADFQMEKPTVRSVISVADTIKLEYDFSLMRDNSAP